MQQIQSPGITGTLRLSPEAAARRAQFKVAKLREVAAEHFRKPARAVPDAAPAATERPWMTARKVLHSAYPVFEQKLPLAIGIHRAIRAAHPELTTKSIRMFLGAHTANRRYRLGLKTGTPRFDLSGDAVGVVTEREAAVAAAQLTKKESA